MLHLPELIFDLALILGAAAVVTLLFKKLKQPLVLGYIIAGFLVGPNFNLFPTITETENIRTWADIGVIFLLFGLGLEFSFKKLIKVGGTALITAIIEVTATIIVGFFIGKMLGWETMDCLFLGGILGIASTTIIIRAFDELGVKSRKFTGVVLGVLVIEDLVAVVLMVLLSTVAVSRSFQGGEMIGSILKLGFFLVLWFLSGIFFIPTFLKYTKKLMNNETMLIVSLALCFGMVLLATAAGFSSALGAFIMGSILAETLQGQRIEHLLTPVKDLFGAIFFVSVGMLIDPQTLMQYTWPIIAGTLVLLIGKPFFVTIGAVISGQPLKTSLQAGMTLSQIGEFSFIIATLGVSLNVTSSFLYPIAVAISVVTSFTTPYMIRLADPLYKVLEKILPEKMKDRMDRYSTGAQSITAISDFKIVVRSQLLNTITNAVIIIAVTFLSLRYLPGIFSKNNWGGMGIVFVILIITAPFLWALSIRRTKREAHSNVWAQKKYRGPLIMIEIVRIALGIFFVAFICDQLFSPKTAIAIAAAIIFIFIVFSKSLKKYYSKIEDRFLSNFYEKERLEEEAAAPKELAPWDAHISYFTAEEDAVMNGKTLEELQLRERFGVNIAMIERGSKIIMAPGKYAAIFPGDKLAAIGTDEQLKAFRTYVNELDVRDNKKQKRQEAGLKQLYIRKESPLIGQTIRSSFLRERAKGIIVGIERNGERILNPESTTTFEENDIIWIVGNIRRLAVLTDLDRRRRNTKS
jgi:CPA2 family monovalent cation:H+ antiporter-2